MVRNMIFILFERNIFNKFNLVLVTPNSSLDTPISSNNNSGSNHIKGSTMISADSSVASSVSLDEEDESPSKVKKKDESHVNKILLK